MAYMYPYGDSQQLNLSWFLAKFKELYEYVMQLDPSGETAMDVILSRFTEQYDSTKTYIPGDYCIYDGYIYKANTTTGGTFNSSAWDAALPVNDVQGLRILLGGLSTDLDALEQNAVTNVQYTPGAATADGLLRQTKNGTASTVITVDKEPTENSQNPVKSGGVYDELTELKGSINTVQGQITAYVENGDTATTSYLAGNYIVWKGNLYKVIANISSGQAFTVNTNIASTTVTADLRTAKSLGSQRNDYTFPTSASAISDGNNNYTVLHDGFAFIRYAYANHTYSQFIPKINGQLLLTQAVTSGPQNWNGLVGAISFPVKKGDIVTVDFYREYAMSEITIRVHYFY